MSPEEFLQAQANIMERVHDIGMRCIGFFKSFAELGKEMKAHDAQIHINLIDVDLDGNNSPSQQSDNHFRSVLTPYPDVLIDHENQDTWHPDSF